jgi:signal transduction histidine kinase
VRHRRTWLGLLLPAGLVLLVGVLAALQYRWLGQVSEAEREQLARTLTLKAREFADEFDREIGQTHAAFQVDANELSTDNAELFAQRLAQWKRGARFPSIVKTIYWARETGQRAEDALALFEYRDDERRFVPVSWPDALALVRDRLIPRLAPMPTPPRAQIVTIGSSVFVDIPAIVVPVAMPAEPVQMAAERSTEFLKRLRSSDPGDILFSVRLGHQSLVLLLDDQEIRQTLLPALAERYFPEIGRDRYRVSIVDGKGTSILNRGLAPGASLDPKQADVATPFFALRLETARGILPGGHVMWGVPASGPPLPPAPSQTITARARGSGQLSVFVEQRATAIEAGRGGVRVGLPGWQLLLQHADGSLDAAVANARRRNLWLSFGILAVLAAGVSLIVLNSRRSERLAAQQMDFVATVSHELRTPLAVIRSAAQNLSAGVVLDNTQTRRYGDLIEGEGRRLTDMVEQVLEFAGLSSGRKATQARATSAAHVIDDAVSASRALIDAHDFELVVTVPDDLPLVSGDISALHRALQNLITNALKHAATGRWLSITASRGAHRGQPEVQIAVSDRGPGIEATDLPHLFEPFYRGRSALERQVQGNGLGLSLVKRIAEAYGGRVTVRSAPGEGSTFTLHLPVAQPDAAADAAAVESPSETPRAATP